MPDVQGNIAYKNGLSLDAYAPQGPRRPAALLIHGSSGDKSTHLTQLFPLLMNTGYAWFSINYHDLADVRAAVTFIRCPGRFPIQPQLLVIGEDTGVSLALELVVDGGFAGVIGFGAANDVAGMRDPSVPVVLFHGDIDTESSSEPLKRACQVWSNCRFRLVPHGIHNLENWHPGEWEWKEEFTAVLRDGRRGLWRDIVYARPGGLPLTMDAYVPEGAGPFPAVIVVHGGGWEAGDKLTYVSPVLSLLAQAHFAWFSINYRLTPFVRNDQQLEDLRAAIRYVRTHADRYGVNPNAVAILGESASGQMVTQVASEPCSGCDVQAVVSFYGVYNFVPWAADPDSKSMLNGVFGEWDANTLQRYSPIFQVHPGMPPVLMLQGTADELCAGTLAYEKRLTQAGVPHELILLENAPHGMENWVGHPEWEFYQQRMISWLRGVLAVPRASNRHTE
ncbi:MAG: alpha/beta hydrolase fold domain-containing protein [Bryobacteraceae bacterium]